MRRRILCTTLGGSGVSVLMMRSVSFKMHSSMMRIVGLARVGLIDRLRCVGIAVIAMRRTNNSACLLSKRCRRLMLFFTFLTMLFKVSWQNLSDPTAFCVDWHAQVSLPC
eukprot:Lithocolla_globosa_v1_NODE_156_length_5631_cov_370.989060.p5 type:complete len:110 gc:universal NODE_156_length_5631_cov_370.989060:652-323(-)